MPEECARADRLEQYVQLLLDGKRNAEIGLAEAMSENERLKEEIIELNKEIVSQNCAMQDGSLDSMAITTNALAMRFLAEKGIIIIEKEYGRRVIGRWAEQSPKGEGVNGKDG